jgi:hypothetical protein
MPGDGIGDQLSSLDPVFITRIQGVYEHAVSRQGIKPFATGRGMLETDSSDGGDHDAGLGWHRPIHRQKGLTGLFRVDDLSD